MRTILFGALVTFGLAVIPARGQAVVTATTTPPQPVIFPAQAPPPIGAVTYVVYPHAAYPVIYPALALPSYSYAVATAYGTLARDYVGYGTNDFPFYGRPYGHPYDAYGWPAIGGYTYRSYAYYNVVP